ncbi:glyoxalase, partial [Pelomonas sp. HMWF004]
PRLSSALYCRHARDAIAWYQQAFGFAVEIIVDDGDGGVAHSELRYGEALIMVAQPSADRDARFGVTGSAPGSAGGSNTQSLFLYVDDVDAHCAQARAAGARITYEPADSDHGPEHWCDRTYACVDPEGHLWWFSQRLRNRPGEPAP